MDEKTYILGIESSCDDTSAAVMCDGILLSNVTASQAVHEAYGGVVPELASRAHEKNIVPVVDQALKRAGVEREQLKAIAFTRGPGLMGSLLVGVSFAKGLAASLGIPMIDVNHLQGHILAHFIHTEGDDYQSPTFPFLCLLVSGGNSQIVLVKSYKEMEIIGQTIDDAAGEAIDKCSKIMELGYPGGPIIDRLAREGNPEAFQFAKPNIPGYDYSFSGLKTSFLYSLRNWVKEDPNFVQNHLQRPGCLTRKDHRGHPDEKTAYGCQGPGHQAGGCGRRCVGQYRTEKCIPGPCQEIQVESIHTQIRIYHRQRRHDSHGRDIQVSRPRLLPHVGTSLLQRHPLK